MAAAVRRSPCTSAARTARRWRPPSPPIAGRPSRWTEVAPTLEDVFIQLMDHVAGQLPMSAAYDLDRALSSNRILAVLIKEFNQLTRDRLTYAMILVMPIVQLMLFGYAINSDPRAPADRRAGAGPRADARARSSRPWPTTAISRSGPRGRLARAELDRAIARGEVQFAVTIPAGLHAPGGARRRRPDPGRGRRLRPRRHRRRRSPPWPILPRTALAHDLAGRAPAPAEPATPFEVVVHRRYNPEAITAYNIVPGLLGVVPVHDPGDDDRAGRDPRIRARHDGEPAGHARPSRSR